MIRAINAMTAAGAIVLLVMSLWPGYAGGCLLFLALPLIALLGLAWLLVVARSLPPSWGRLKPARMRQVTAAPMFVCLTLAVLIFYVPRRLAFAACRGRFNSYLSSAPVSDHEGAKLDKWIGIYHVDHYAADPRGGVYFRTCSTADGLGPDTMSYGFVFRPNRQGTPFGESSYVVRRLGGGCYWFQVSND